MDLALQLRRHPAIILKPESPFFRSRFSAVISAITSLARLKSAAMRCSLALGFSDPLANTFDAEPNSCFFHP